MRRLIAAFTVLLCLLVSACADEAPLTLRTATSAEEVEQFLLFPDDAEALPEVQTGYIRYISQLEGRDPTFRKAYWYVDGEDAMLDLTLTQHNGYEFALHVKVMCTRAAYSMALSCLGIDMTPGEMSAVTGARNLAEPYDMISDLVGVEQVIPSSKVFNTMVENYLSDERYSPVYLYIQKPNGSYHALLVVGIIPEKGRYLVVDSNPYYVDNEPIRVYFVSLNTMRTEIINSTFRKELVGSKVLQLYQWRLRDDAAE